MTTEIVNKSIEAPRLLAGQGPKLGKSRPSCNSKAGEPLRKNANTISSEPPHDLSQAILAITRGIVSSGIICGTDFSIHSSEAAEVAAVLASKLGRSLALAHIAEPVRGDATAKSLNAMLRYRGRNKLSKEADRLRAFGPTVEEIFLSGSPAAELVKCASRNGAGLVVVSSVSSLFPTRWLLGSVANQTAQLSPVPVLVVRDPKPFKAWASGKRALNILIGHDFSETSDAALAWVAGLRKVGRCRITVVHLSTPQVTNGWIEIDGKPGRRKNLIEIREMLRSDLMRRCRRVLGRSRFDVDVISVRDSLAPRLVSLAKLKNADLIVVGTSQKGTLRRLCLGSVSSGVLREALGSVACVPRRSD